jgi:DNA-directed RNA polymerase specialized sigma subunit
MASRIAEHGISTVSAIRAALRKRRAKSRDPAFSTFARHRILGAMLDFLAAKIRYRA